MNPFRRWWPVVVWAAVIWTFSTHWFTADNTGAVILPALRWLFPQADPVTLRFVHHVIRKCGHLTEYFIFSLLVLRAIRGPRRGVHLAWALGAIALVGAYASLDEFHQSFVPGRTATMSDVMLDTSGGILAQGLAALLAWRTDRHERRLEATVEAPRE